MTNKLDQWFVDGWRCSWKWLSLQMHVIACLLLGVVEAAPVLPPDVQKMIPQPWAGIVLGLWAVLGVIARLKRQGRPSA